MTARLGLVIALALACSDPRRDVQDEPAPERDDAGDGGREAGVDGAGDQGSQDAPADVPQGLADVAPVADMAPAFVEVAPEAMAPPSAEEIAFGCPPDDELRACYTFDDLGASGDMIRDGSRHGHHGSRMLALTAIGVRGRGLKFTAEQFALVADAPALRLAGSSATFEAWVSPSKVTPDGYVDFFVGKWTRDSFGYLFGTSSGLVTMHQSGNVGRNSELAVPLNVWSHVAAVLTPDGVAFYINGRRTKLALDAPLVLKPNDEPVTIGNRNPATNELPTVNTAFYGTIDVLRIYGRPRTAAEICADAAGRWNGTICAPSSNGSPPP